VSLVTDISDAQVEQLAVLYCDINPADGDNSTESEVGLWRVNYFRAAGEVAADYGGHEATTPAGGWAATFCSTVDALMCAQALASLVGWYAGGPSLSGGLSAGDVIHEPSGINGRPVWEAVALCRQALPRQVLVADPLKVVVAADTARSFAPSSLEVSSLQAAALTEPTPEPDGPWPGAPMPRIVASPPRRSRHLPHGHTGRGSGHLDTHARGERLVSESALRLLTRGDHEVRTAPTTATPTTALPAGGPSPLHSPSAPAPPEAETDITRLRLTVLGWVQIEAEEPSQRCCILRGSQARAVVSMLALRRGPVHKEELAELLWPAGLPEHWEGAIRGLVTKIRRFLEEGGLPARDTLVAEGGYYELRLPEGVTVDRDAAGALAGSATTALADGRYDEAVRMAHGAVTILERRLMSGLDNSWFDQVRAELAHERLAALELWARAELKSGNLEGAKRAATEALALDPYRECSYRLLMEAHAVAGSRGEALRIYERCRRMLAEDLGVGPAAQTQALYLHLLG